MTVEQIARVAHEANRAYCQTLGDHSQVSWDEAPDWQHQSGVDGADAILRYIMRMGRPMPPSESHERWRQRKLADGWKYGPVKDTDKKEHPCLVPYRKLPHEQRHKDRLFIAVVKTFFAVWLINWRRK